MWFEPPVYTNQHNRCQLVLKSETSAKEAGEYQLSLHKAADDAALQTMRDAGVEIIELDTEPFREPVLAAMDDYIKSKGDDVYAVYQKMLEVSAD